MCAVAAPHRLPTATAAWAILSSILLTSVQVHHTRCIFSWFFVVLATAPYCHSPTVGCWFWRCTVISTRVSAQAAVAVNCVVASQRASAVARCFVHAALCGAWVCWLALCMLCWRLDACGRGTGCLGRIRCMRGSVLGCACVSRSLCVVRCTATVRGATAPLAW